MHLRTLSVNDTIDTTISKSVSFELHTATDEDGKFMFGYVPPGTYALGCSYSACNIAFHKIRSRTVTNATPEGGNNSSEDPVIRISVDACEGMVCHVAVATITPDDWSDSQPAAATTITKDWNNRASWLKRGGGITLRIDRASSVISGKIEVE